MRYLEQYCVEANTLVCDFKLLLCSSLLTDKLFLVASSILLPEGMQRKHGGEYCVSTLTSAFYFVHNDIPSFVYYEVVYPFLKLIRVSITTQQQFEVTR